MRKGGKIAVAVLSVAGLAAAVVLTRPEAGAPAPPVPVAAPARESAPVPARRAEPASGHGPNDVVRSRERLDKAGDVRRERFEPDWDHPLTLTFSELKRRRRETAGGGDFLPATVRALSGAAVEMKGAVMPIDPVPESGEMRRLWLSNPLIVMAGCVFCNPPTLSDIVYVTTPPGAPYRVDRELLYRSVLMVRIRGRLVLGPVRTAEGTQYMFGIELREVVE
jgi:hypothetical protein